MRITVGGTSEFRQLAAKFRAAGKEGARIRRELTKRIQVELRATADDIRHEAQGMKVRGVRGSSTLRREAHHLAHRKRGLEGGYGLRAMVARSVKTRVSYTGRKIGAWIYIDTSTMPTSQRRLPRHLNNPEGWRHPVYGNRDRWVRQTGEPYFDRPIRRRVKRMREAVDLAIQDALKELR